MIKKQAVVKPKNNVCFFGHKVSPKNSTKKRPSRAQIGKCGQ
ncbi:hypothetical protein CHK_0065 [Christensenella hongkongensis]|uniref:Uncharacterized protein n=1 Tax=Christensenella hongkongensis TaxID=270498 RepID=A0A0M2NJU8_9FIRM|nr:hypothetical protein CHK_0065 [Christensenella hongkongensis]